MLLELFPELAEAGSAASMHALDDKLASLPSPMMAITNWIAGLNLPESFEIPCWSDRWLALDPVAELVGMVGAEKVVSVHTSEP
jgi:hypothetical protein